MSLKENLLKVIDTALELASEAPQTIEIRGAIKQLNQAKGSVSQSYTDVVPSVDSVSEVKDIDVISEDVKPTVDVNISNTAPEITISGDLSRSKEGS